MPLLTFRRNLLPRDLSLLIFSHNLRHSFYSFFFRSSFTTYHIKFQNSSFFVFWRYRRDSFLLHKSSLKLFVSYFRYSFECLWQIFWQLFKAGFFIIDGAWRQTKHCFCLKQRSKFSLIVLWRATLRNIEKDVNNNVRTPQSDDQKLRGFFVLLLMQTTKKWNKNGQIFDCQKHPISFYTRKNEIYSTQYTPWQSKLQENIFSSYTQFSRSHLAGKFKNLKTP
jgi:hypothetical protein